MRASTNTFVHEVERVASAPAALAVRRVTKVFPRRVFRAEARPPVLVDVSLSVDFGAIVALMGPNGAGKTTLLETIAALIQPTSGTIEVCGVDVMRHPAHLRALVAYAGATGHGFYARMSARWNLEFFGLLNNLTRVEARRRAVELMADVGLEHAMSSAVETFSDGMRQRLGLARALIADPAVLLLDEPTRSVDPAFRQVLYRLLRRWRDANSRRAILMVTHSLEEAHALCDSVCVLDRGHVLWEGPTLEARGLAASWSLERTIYSCKYSKIL